MGQKSVDTSPLLDVTVHGARPLSLSERPQQHRKARLTDGRPIDFVDVVCVVAERFFGESVIHFR
jgi:hypothetical protein